MRAFYLDEKRIANKQTKKMDNCKMLRQINETLKYKELKDYIDEDILLNIKDEDELVSQLRTLIQENLHLEVGSIVGGDLMRGIAKLGILDATFELKREVSYPEIGGIEILRSTGWIDKKAYSDQNMNGFNLLPEVAQQISMGKNYLKVFAVAHQSTINWLKEKTYLVKQVIRKEEIKPKVADEIMIFSIEDVCITNYAGIWLCKHFYM